MLAIIVEVGSFEEAKKVVDIGVDGIIVQGVEAGGHIIGLVLEYFCSRYLCNLYYYCFQPFILILLEDLKHRYACFYLQLTFLLYNSLINSCTMH